MLFILLAAGLEAAPAAAAPASPAWCSVPVAEASQQVKPLAAHLKEKLDQPPQPVAHVHTEHTKTGDPEREASLTAEKDLPIMRDAAVAWRAGAGEAYGVFAARYLSAWLHAYHPDLDPIDETNFDALIDTYAIMKNQLPPQTRDGIQRYFREWAQGYIDSIDQQRFIRRGRGPARPNPTITNNWQSHRIKLITMMAAATGDAKLLRQARELFWEQVDANIDGSGEVLDFRQRDAMHYVIYDLEPLLQAALAARSMGEDWYHPRKPDGRSLEAAVRWLEPYATGEKTHKEFVRTNVAFDTERAQAGEPGFSGMFEPKKASRLYWLAAEFDPHYQELAQRLSPRGPFFITLCGQ